MAVPLNKSPMKNTKNQTFYFYNNTEERRKRGKIPSSSFGFVSIPLLKFSCDKITDTKSFAKGDITRDDSQGRLFAQHSYAMLAQCCNHLNQCRNNVATLCFAKNRCSESSRVQSPQGTPLISGHLLMVPVI